MQEEYKALRLENQLCFPLYACAKEVTRRYKPFLDHRSRYRDDERALCVRITEEGERLQDKALFIPKEMRACIPLNDEEMLVLKKLLSRTLTAIEQSGFMSKGE